MKLTAANTTKTTVIGMESQNIRQLTPSLQKPQKYLTIYIIPNNVKSTKINILEFF